MSTSQIPGQPPPQQPPPQYPSQQQPGWGPNGPQPPRKRHRLRKWLLITPGVVVGLIVIVIALSAAFSSGVNHAVNPNSVATPTSVPASSAPPASAASTPTPSGPDMLAMGTATSVTSNGTPAASITVSSPVLSTQPADQYGSVPANGYFVTVSVAATADQSYTGGFDINPLDFYALANGTHYTWDNGNAMSALADPNQELSATTLAAGENASGKLAFDVPSPHGYIVYAPNLNGQPLAEWKY